MYLNSGNKFVAIIGILLCFTFKVNSSATITCHVESIGDTLTRDGITYTKVDRNTLDNYVANPNDWYKLETSCTSGVDDMSSLFEGKEFFNRDISSWDTSNVITMNSMFKDAESFDGDISNWDTSSVTDMYRMFDGAEAFNGNISTWDTSNVRFMGYMFKDALDFNQDLSNWCITFGSEPLQFSSNSGLDSNNYPKWDGSACSTLIITCHDISIGQTLFRYGETYTKVDRTMLDDYVANPYHWYKLEISCTSGVEDMNGLFLNTNFNRDISNWDTSSVNDMEAMFKENMLFNQNLSKWDTSNVINMNSMFKDAESFDGDISNWDTSSVTDMYRMFDGAEAFNGNISTWNTSNVRFMDYMFKNASAFNQDLSNWCITFGSEPLQFSSNSGLDSNNYPKWDGSACSTLIITCHEYSIGQTLFRDGITYTKVDRTMLDNYVANPNDWYKLEISCTSGVENMSTLFLNTNFNRDISNWDTSSVNDMEAMFKENMLFNQNLSKWDTSNVINMNSMFKDAENFDGDISLWKTSSVRDMSRMFDGAEAFNGNISTWDTSNVTDMSGMFYNASAFNQDLSNWDTSNVIYMNYMFNNAAAFNQDLSSWSINNNIVYTDFASNSALSEEHYPLFPTTPTTTLTTTSTTTASTTVSTTASTTSTTTVSTTETTTSTTTASTTSTTTSSTTSTTTATTTASVNTTTVPNTLAPTPAITPIPTSNPTTTTSGPGPINEPVFTTPVIAGIAVGATALVTLTVGLVAKYGFGMSMPWVVKSSGYIL